LKLNHSDHDKEAYQRIGRNLRERCFNESSQHRQSK
jgi:hypothetical protein